MGNQMKITLVRVCGSKDPAMLLLGHPRKKLNEAGFFWLVDECCDPNVCEYWETEFKPDCFGIYWPGKDQFGARGDAELTGSADEQLTELFNADHVGWIKIDFHFDDDNNSN